MVVHLGESVSQGTLPPPRIGIPTSGSGALFVRI